MKRMLAVVVLGHVLSLTAAASGPLAMRKTIEATMQVTGEVVIAPDGSLKSYALDQREALPADVRALIERQIPAWRFTVRTASGQPEEITAKMSLQMIARPIDGGKEYRATIGAWVFEDARAPQLVTATLMDAPHYPMAAVAAGATGTVYVVLRLNPDGTVAEAHAEQINMTVVASEKVLQRWRDVLAKSALGKSRQWTFKIAPQRLAMPRPVSVRVPIDYRLLDEAVDKLEPKHGKWSPYVPGPYAPIPWERDIADDGGVGAMAPGRVYPLDAPIQLRTPSAGS